MSSPLSPTSSTCALWIGTFPVAGLGTPAGLGEGIWRTEIDLVTGPLAPARQVCTIPAPSFLVRDPGRPLIHATAEVEHEGSLSHFAVTEETLELASSSPSGGGAPTHLAWTPTALYVSNYSEGTWAALELGDDGLPSGVVARRTWAGSGPNAERQEGPHAHSTTLLGDVALVADLGTDSLRMYPLGSGGLPIDEGGAAFALGPGSGPRHGIVREGGRFIDVVTELSAEVVTMTWNGKNLFEVGRVKVASAPSSLDQPSHIAASNDGRRVYVANRGPGTIAVFDVESMPGALRRVGEVWCGSSWPRHFAVIDADDGGEFIVVAGELANRVHVLRRAPGHAVPDLLDGDIEIPSPAFVLVDQVGSSQSVFPA